MNTFVASSLLFSSHGRNSLVAPPICRNWDFVFITHLLLLLLLLVVVVVVGKMVFTVQTSILFQSEMEKERRKSAMIVCVQPKLVLLLFSVAAS